MNGLELLFRDAGFIFYRRFSLCHKLPLSKKKGRMPSAPCVYAVISLSDNIAYSAFDRAKPWHSTAEYTSWSASSFFPLSEQPFNPVGLFHVLCIVSPATKKVKTEFMEVSYRVNGVIFVGFAQRGPEFRKIKGNKGLALLWRGFRLMCRSAVLRRSGLLYKNSSARGNP